jgi:hypothetical protein
MIRAKRNATFGGQLCLVLKLRVISYVWKGLKCGAGKRWIDFARTEILHKVKEEGE